MTSGFEYLEHTSDVLVRAYSESLEGAFEQAARAVMGVLIRNPLAILPVVRRSFVVSSNTTEDLLCRYLEEFLFIFDTEKLLFSKFEVRIRKSDSTLTSEVAIFGERLDPSRHRPGVEVKAITYHMMQTKQERRKVELVFLLDI